MLGDLEHKTNGIVKDLQRCEGRRQPRRKTDINDGTDDLRDMADGSSIGELISHISREASAFWATNGTRRLRRGGRRSAGRVVDSTVQ